MLKIYRVDMSTLQVTYNHNVTLDYDATADEFKNALRQFDIYSPYTINNVIVTDTGTVRTWNVSIWHLRNDDHY